MTIELPPTATVVESTTNDAVISKLPVEKEEKNVESTVDETAVVDNAVDPNLSIQIEEPTANVLNAGEELLPSQEQQEAAEEAAASAAKAADPKKKGLFTNPFGKNGQKGASKKEVPATSEETPVSTSTEEVKPSTSTGVLEFINRVKDVSISNIKKLAEEPTSPKKKEQAKAAASAKPADDVAVTEGSDAIEATEEDVSAERPPNSNRKSFINKLFGGNKTKEEEKASTSKSPETSDQVTETEKDETPPLIRRVTGLFGKISIKQDGNKKSSEKVDTTKKKSVDEPVAATSDADAEAGAPAATTEAVTEAATEATGVSAEDDTKKDAITDEVTADAHTHAAATTTTNKDAAVLPEN